LAGLTLGLLLSVSMHSLSFVVAGLDPATHD